MNTRTNLFTALIIFTSAIAFFATGVNAQQSKPKPKQVEEKKYQPRPIPAKHSIATSGATSISDIGGGGDKKDKAPDIKKPSKKGGKKPDWWDKFFPLSTSLQADGESKTRKFKKPVWINKPVFSALSMQDTGGEKDKAASSGKKATKTKKEKTSGATSTW